MPRTLAVLLAPALLLAVAPADPVPKMKPQDSYYPTAKGAKWVYDVNGADTPQVVTGVEKKGGATVVSVERRTNLEGRPVVTAKVAVSDEGLYQVEADGRALDPPWCLLKLPHRPGNKWKNTGEDPGQTETRTGFGPEEVEVPAGKYKAIRVESEALFEGKLYRSTTWFAPGVGLVKFVHHDGEVHVLKSFTPGKD